MVVEIVTPRSEHETGWRILWDQYCGRAISDAVSIETWRRLLDPTSAIGGYVAVSDGNVIGFVNYVVHEGTWVVKPVCYVEDVFVSKTHRGRGSLVAKAMADRLVARVNSGEWSRLWGITASDSFVAQRLYSIFAVGRGYMRYVMRGDE